jgi:hypothetical protein
MLSFHGKPGENHGKYTVRELLSSCYLFSRQSLTTSPVVSLKDFWGAPEILSSSVAHPKGFFHPVHPDTLSGIPSPSRSAPQGTLQGGRTEREAGPGVTGMTRH